MIRRNPTGFRETESHRIPSDRYAKFMKCYKFDEKSLKLFYKVPYLACRILHVFR